MPSVQEYARKRIVIELQKKLNVELGIGHLNFQPFNTLELNDIYLYDQINKEAFRAEKVYASIDLFHLIQKKITITSVKLANFNVNLSKETNDSPINIQFVIDAFKSQDPNKKSPNFDFQINSVNINNGNFKFDINDQPHKEIGLFDAKHIDISNINARLALKSLKEDSINIQVKRLSLAEKSGLRIDNLIVRIITQGKHLFVKGFVLDMPKTLLEFGKCEIDLSSVQSTDQLLDSAKFECVIAPSYISPKDVSAFTPILKNFTDRILLRSKITGSIDNIFVSNLSLDYGEKMHIRTNANIKDVRDAEKLYLTGSVDELNITPEGIQGLSNNFSSENSEIPKEISRLGTVTFNGTISGYLKELKANGAFNTQLGTIKTDLLFGFKSKVGLDSYFNGKISTTDFKLSELVENKDLDKLSFDLAINLEKPTNRPMKGVVKGNIQEFQFKSYTYQNILIDGSYDGLKLDGQINFNDINGSFYINGLFDLSKKHPELNFIARLKNVRLDEYHLTEKYKSSFLSLSVNANFTGKNIDDTAGYLSIDSLSFQRVGKKFFMNEFLVEASGLASDRKLKIKSDLIEGEVVGAYSFSTIFESFKQTLSTHLPALINTSDKKNKKLKNNDLKLNFAINNTEVLSDILELPFTVLSKVNIVGFYNNNYNKFRIETFLPSVKFGDILLKSGYFLAENPNNQIHANISGALVSKKNVTNDLDIDLVANDNIVDTKLSFSNDSNHKISGTFALSTLFSRKNDKNPLRIEANVKPGNLILNDSLWQINKSKILVDSSFVAINNFNIHNLSNSQSININGKYSQKNPNDILHLKLNNINLEYIFNILAIHALNFGGSATGDLYASSIEEKPYANINLKVQNFKFNSTELGNLTLYSELDKESNKVILDGYILNKESRRTDIGGYVNPITKKLEINFDADKINIGFLNKYAESLFNNISGKGSGKVTLLGDFSDVTVAGKAFIENGSLGINFLNTNYTFTDTIHLKKDLIYFNNVTFLDKFGNKALLSGKVVHNYFSDFLYHVELAGENFMLYNASESLNPTLYGQVFGSGTGYISGDENALDINLRMKTNDKTNIHMNFMEESVSEYSFISYKSKVSELPNDSVPVKKPRLLTSNTGMEINMNFFIEATPEATFEILMDPIGGDVLKGSGKGSMQFMWGTKIEPRLYGNYVINRGSYNFTFQKIFERKFSIQDGSSVQFQGDPFQANMNVNAIYRLTANLNDLDQSIAQLAGQSNVPVNTVLNITGPLRQPNIKLDVTLPSADAEVQRQLKSLLNNDDMINRQVVYLLLLSKFYTADNANVNNKTSDFASVASATLSSQLSNILSQIDDRWQIGTNIRTSDSQFSTTEVELLLSSQLLNNRLLFNGNFGYRDDPRTQSSWIGDVDIELLLNKIGTWRAKAYNKTRENYYFIDGSNSTQKQGVGLLYKKDFDYLRELFTREKKKVVKKDTIKPILPDSTIKGSPISQFIRIKK